MLSPWRTTARRVIAKALEDGRAAGLEGQALVKYVDNHYPFHLRKMHPCKIWLSERALLVFGVRKPMGRNKPSKAARVEGQGELFTDEEDRSC